MSNSYELKWNEITEKNFYFYFFFGMAEGLTLRECIHGKGSQTPPKFNPLGIRELIMTMQTVSKLI